MNIEESLKVARTPEKQFCSECQEFLFSPMDKLSIALYGKCSMHFEDDSHEEKNLITLSSSI